EAKTAMRPDRLPSYLYIQLSSEDMQALFFVALSPAVKAFLSRLANPFPSRRCVSVSPAHLLKERTQARQLGAIKAGDDIGLRFLPVRQRMEEDRFAAPRCAARDTRNRGIHRVWKVVAAASLSLNLAASTHNHRFGCLSRTTPKC